jgi:hypothetical protein
MDAAEHLKGTAYHEAGHAVVAWALGLPGDVYVRKMAGALDWRRHMRNIVDEAGDIIAKATDDHTLVGGHLRLAVAASLGRELFWQDTGQPMKLDAFFRGSSHRHTA